MRQEILPDAKPCDCCRDGKTIDHTGVVDCSFCRGTGYVIPSSLRVDRPAKPGDRIELCVEKSDATGRLVRVMPNTGGGAYLARVIAVAEVTDCTPVQLYTVGDGWPVIEAPRPSNYDVTFAAVRPPTPEETT